MAASPQVYMGAMPEGQGEQVSHWWFSGIGCLTANDKDFSLALEMTVGESHQSLLAPRQSSLLSNFASGESQPLVFPL